MIIEFFGLSKTGKSSLKRKLKEAEYNVLNPLSFLKKMLFFLKYLIKHPISTSFLFYKLNTNHIEFIDFKLSIYNQFRVLKMRNSYIISLLAKYEKAKKRKGLIFSDELAFQSLFMFFQRKADEQEIRSIIKMLPKSDLLCLFERSREERHKIYSIPHPNFKKNPTMFPGGWINVDYAKAWMNVMEYNYEIIKQIIQKDYKEAKNEFKGIPFKFPKTYKIKN